ncbi:24455_t:CDS:2 [Gigaspora margarita]|uniref:24455_t:CDS:1 n=1 Tax=Gigaspora margarita TaxID=4874 RepID=A0ABN7UAW4_GIGMA|nr:24455_t:CDS:2 [Gigaspora margarita]
MGKRIDDNLENKVAKLVQIKQKKDKSVKMYTYRINICAEQYKKPKDDEFKSNLDNGIDCCNHDRIEIELSKQKVAYDDKSAFNNSIEDKDITD